MRARTKARMRVRTRARRRSKRCRVCRECEWGEKWVGFFIEDGPHNKIETRTESL
jgi:RNA polymerase subunit RPABC4/transcription elongation factor Spt4